LAKEVALVISIRETSSSNRDRNTGYPDRFFVVQVCKKGKAIPVTGRGDPQGCETTTLQHFTEKRLTDGGEVVSVTCQAIPATGRGGL
jgi:hypothetical protein